MNKSPRVVMDVTTIEGYVGLLFTTGDIHHKRLFSFHGLSD